MYFLLTECLVAVYELIRMIYYSYYGQVVRAEELTILMAAVDDTFQVDADAAATEHDVEKCTGKIKTDNVAKNHDNNKNNINNENVSENIRLPPQPTPEWVTDSHYVFNNWGEMMLRQRDDLLTNMYIVSSGVFFSLFALTHLDTQSVAYFMNSVWMISVWEALRRTRTLPDCVEPTRTCVVHQWSSWVEVIILCLFAAFLVELIAFNQLDSSPPAVFTTISSSLAPFFMWFAPKQHHPIIVFETSIPLATFVALALLYAMSPIESYVLELRNMHGTTLFFTMVPLCVPFWIICMIHAFRKGFTIFIFLALAMWTCIFQFLQHTETRLTDSLLWSMLVLVTLATILFAYLLHYRFVHIQSQIIIAPVATQRPINA
jgi:hypothetical protein